MGLHRTSAYCWDGKTCAYVYDMVEYIMIV